MKSEADIRRIFLWVTLYSIAMGFLETAVVVYLRDIYYPEGFNFPMKLISSSHTVVEVIREAATLIMLIGIGIIAGKNKWDKFAYFLFSFAVWDIFYYVFLKLLLNWPESILTWDILFLIPVVWAGPVLSPVISACTMILLSVIIIFRNNNDDDIKVIGKNQLWMLITGAIIQIVAYCYDFTSFLIHNRMRSNYGIKDMTYKYTPDNFPWWLFLTGELLTLFVIWKIYKTNYSR